jgi:hypothetical protein
MNSYSVAVDRCFSGSDLCDMRERSQAALGEVIANAARCDGAPSAALTMAIRAEIGKKDALHLGCCSPDELIHSSICDAVSASRAFLMSSSRRAPGAKAEASARASRANT